MIQYQIIGKRIQLKRKELKLRQNELAEILGISNNHLSSIENGKYRPSLETLIAICDALKITPDYVLLGNTHPPNIPESVIENLRLCSDEDLQLAKDFSELLVRRNQKKWNSKNHI